MARNADYHRRSKKHDARDRDRRDERRVIEYRPPEPPPPPEEPFTFHFRPRNDRQREAEFLFPSCDILGLIGPAGTGKTIAAAALGVSEVYHGRAKRLTVIRPCVEAGDNPIGWLAGTLEDKLNPHYAVFGEKIREVSHKFPAKKLRKLSLNYIRGMTFRSEVVIVDEAQNFTLKELRLILERLGEGSQLIFMGDPEQPDIARSGLVEFFERLHGVEGVGCVQFLDEDIVRHPRLGLWLHRLRG